VLSVFQGGKAARAWRWPATLPLSKIKDQSSYKSCHFCIFKKGFGDIVTLRLKDFVLPLPKHLYHSVYFPQQFIELVWIFHVWNNEKSSHPNFTSIIFMQPIKPLRLLTSCLLTYTLCCMLLIQIANGSSFGFSQYKIRQRDIKCLA